MDLFRLTYFNCSNNETNKWNASYRFEIYGSAEAICDIYLTLKKLGCMDNSTHEDWGAIPRFVEVYNKDGVNLTKELKQNGLMGLYSNSNNTFK